MIITSQDRKNKLNHHNISRFHLDGDHSIYAYHGESDEATLLGTYKTSDRALDVEVEITDAIWNGRDYQMPTDD